MNDDDVVVDLRGLDEAPQSPFVGALRLDVDRVAKLTALGKKIEAFKKVQTRPRQGVAKKAAANKALPRLFLQARNILTRRVDRLMVQFKASAPEFFAEFETARKIVNQPGSQGTRATNATPSAKAA